MGLVTGKENTKQIGKKAEQKALAYLRGKGLTLVAQNYLCPLGEIDLIMRHSDYLVFVEVRMRTSALFGGALLSITPGKKQKIIKASLHYLMVSQCMDKFPLRFDVISIDGVEGTIEWIEDAFGLDY